MKISPITNNISPVLSFKSNRGNTYNKINNPLSQGKNIRINSNYTYFFREDLDFGICEISWIPFRKLIAKNFENDSNVEVYNFASSDGSEAYSFAISMIEELGENAEKFFPIKAYDIDDSIIESAKSGSIPCDLNDIRILCSNTNGKIDKYFYKERSSENSSLPYTLVSKPFLKSLINFEVGDIRDKIDEISSNPSLIFCRNFWPYLPQDDIYPTLERLVEKAAPKSILVFGDYDKVVFKRKTPEVLKNDCQNLGNNIFKKNTKP